MKKIIFFLLLITSQFPQEIIAQEFQIFLFNIKENRSIVFNDQTPIGGWREPKNQIKLSTSLNGLQLDKDHLVKINDLKVVEDQGNVVREMESSKERKYTTSKLQEIVLEAPKRKAKSLTLSGEVLYFNPDTSNNGFIVITNFLDRKGENLFDNQGNEAELIALTTAQILEAYDKLDKNFLKQLNEPQEELSREEKQEIEITRGILGSMIRKTKANPETILSFKTNKKPEDFYSIEVFTEDKKLISTGFTYVEGLYQVTLSEKLSENSFIEIKMDNEDAVKKIDFRLEDILLP
ncbi:hypothetical protein [Zunongwangia endophytica]|uniref:Uncharacterized protein n=1 Tax=Zunongwangia endophytica TaxID=1808945 RepID=A0ABV8HB89_9FLAO|nr:hypothetical protein [Zunongwangia endophytica]MDN3596786.1 hypothetical protein [Zunongwangia endophytica]